MKSRIIDKLDFEKTNALLEGFNQSTGFVTAILDLEGTVLTKSGWRKICIDFHRKNPQTAAKCTLSDLLLADHNREDERFHFNRCFNGLIDVSVPLVFGGEHVANLYSGQFFFEKPDVAFFKKQAEEFGFDAFSYLQALEEVPVVSKENVETAMKFLKDMILMIIELTNEKTEHKALNQEFEKNERTLLENQAQLNQNMDDLLESQRIAGVGTWRLDLSTDQVVWSEELYRMYGFDPSEPPPPYREHMKLFTPRSWERLSTALDLTRKNGVPYELELETVTSDGSNGWMWVRGEAIEDSSGKIVSLRGAAQDISEQKKIECRLKESEEKFQLLFEQAPLGYLALDANGCFVEVNQKWLDTFGYKKEEVIGKWLGNFLSPEDVEAFRHRFEDFKTEGTVQSEVEMLCSDDHRLLIAFEGKIAYDANGDFIQTHGIMQDITEQRKTEEALVRSESRYRRLSEQSRTFTWEVDERGLFTFVDHVGEKVLGYHPEELIGKVHFYDLYPEEDREAFKQKVFAVFEQKGLFRDLENKAVTKTGDTVMLSTNGFPILNKDGILTGYRGSDADITARKRIEDALHHSHDLMRYVIEHNRSAVAVHDRDLNYLYVSQRYLDVYGIDDQEIIGKHHYEVFPDLPQKWRDVHQKALQGVVSSKDKDLYLRENGAADWTRWECRPWYESDGSIGGIIVYTEVITERIRLIEELKKNEKNLREAQRIAHVGSFDYDTVSQRLTLSLEALRIFGITDQEFTGTLDEVTAFIYPEDRAYAFGLFEKARSEKSIQKSELTLIRKDGQKRIIDFRVGPTFDESRHCVGVTGTIQDITERRKAEEDLLHMNNYDQLTDLLNRRFFEYKLRRMDISSQLPLSLIIADINGLKLINDSFGFAEGDKIIIEAAELLSRCSREEDILARTGGDEFRILLPRTSVQEALKRLKIIQAACDAFNAKVMSEAYRLNLSFGVSTKISESEDFAQVSTRAEDAMNQRKLLDKNSSYSAIISSIQATLLEKSHETKEHSERLALLSRRIGLSLNLSEIELAQIELLATLHDIGKVGIAEQILKKPGKLSAEEWTEMKKHPEIGYRIAMSCPNLAPIAEYILHHHERWDGSGYPHNLQGADIPLISRIISVVDAYDAMTEDRVYRKGMTHVEAIEEIQKCSGSQFDPRVVAVFIQAIGARDTIGFFRESEK